MTSQNFCVLLLNLDRDTERLAYMQKQLQDAQITFSRQPGVLGDAVPYDLRPFFYAADGGPKTTMKRGEIGCYASHISALRRVASGEMGPVVLVLEDDVEISPDLKSIIEQAQIGMPDSWDVLRLSNPPRRAYAPIATLEDGRFVVRYSKIPNSAAAYLITPAGAQKFLDHGIRGLTFDDDLRRPWFHHMDTYGVVPPPAKAGMLQSSIDAIECGRFNKGVSSRMERILRGDHYYALKRLSYNIVSLGFGVWVACEVINLIDMIFRRLTRHSLIHRLARLFPVGHVHA